jgi:hypothetical protein
MRGEAFAGMAPTFPGCLSILNDGGLDLPAQSVWAGVLAGGYRLGAGTAGDKPSRRKAVGDAGDGQ